MSRTGGAPPRVLVVDDNRDAADMLGVLLELFGCEVRVCYDGATALAVAGSFRPEVCLLDLCMPGMDGYALAGRVRAALPDSAIRLAAVTALGGEDARRRSAAAGFDVHLVKPVTPDTLLLAIDGEDRPVAEGWV